MAKLPTNIKLFIEQVMGVPDPITEADFTPEEIRFISEQVRKKQRENEEREKVINHLAETYSSTSHPEEPLLEKGRLQALADYNAKLASYAKSRGKTAIRYEDYPEDLGFASEVGDDRLSYLDSLRASMSSPAYNVQTSLGQYVAHQNPDGTTTVRDNYDWNRPSTAPTPSMFLQSIPHMLRSPEALGNVMMRFFAPSRSRDVRVNLNNLSPSTPPSNNLKAP